MSKLLYACFGIAFVFVGVGVAASPGSVGPMASSLVESKTNPKVGASTLQKYCLCYSRKVTIADARGDGCGHPCYFMLAPAEACSQAECRSKGYPTCKAGTASSVPSGVEQCES